MESFITNEFARLLVFYENIKRSKLNENDLNKVYKKYSKTPQQMIIDISKKYPEFNFPQSVTYNDLIRIKSLYQIPNSFFEQISNGNDNFFQNTYNNKQDIRDSNFDSLLVLNNRNLIASNLHSNLVDNLSKAKYLLPGAGPEPIRKIPSIIKSNPSHQSTQNQNIHILDRIAAASSKEKVVSEEGEITLQDSPLALLDKFMKEKKRVRILIRNKNSIRGTVDGVLRAFDRHFNMLLIDVEEQYTIPQQYRSISNPNEVDSNNNNNNLDKFNPENKLNRHLPQLLVRGDNVVLVCPSIIH